MIFNEVLEFKVGRYLLLKTDKDSLNNKQNFDYLN